jgi:hypothetical protein
MKLAGKTFRKLKKRLREKSCMLDDINLNEEMIERKLKIEIKRWSGTWNRWHWAKNFN